MKISPKFSVSSRLITDFETWLAMMRTVLAHCRVEIEVYENPFEFDTYLYDEDDNINITTDFPTEFVNYCLGEFTTTQPDGVRIVHLPTGELTSIYEAYILKRKLRALIA